MLSFLRSTVIVHDCTWLYIKNFLGWRGVYEVNFLNIHHHDAYVHSLPCMSRSMWQPHTGWWTCQGSPWCSDRTTVSRTPPVSLRSMNLHDLSPRYSSLMLRKTSPTCKYDIKIVNILNICQMSLCSESQIVDILDIYQISVLINRVSDSLILSYYLLKIYVRFVFYRDIRLHCYFKTMWQK